MVAVEKLPSAASSTAGSGATGSSATSASFSSGAGQGFDTWAEECVDKWNTPAGYAISELKGWQLETLLQQLGYTWSASDERWSDGQTRLYVFNGSTEPLTDEEIGTLDKGGAGAPVLFQIETKNYPAAQSAYSGLVSEVMVSEDSEFLDGMGFGIAYGPSMSRFLVYVTEDDEDVDVFFFNEKAIESGMFDRITGGSYGTSVKEAFNNVVGR